MFSQTCYSFFDFKIKGLLETQRLNLLHMGEVKKKKKKKNKIKYLT